jgi:Tfp pilus assembly protein PilF
MPNAVDRSLPVLRPRWRWVLCWIAAATLWGVPDAAAAKKRDPKPADQMKFGVEMARRQLWSEALFRFQQAAAQDPGNPRVYNNLAVACEATGQFDKALEYYRKALQMDPGNRDLRGNYSRFVEFYQSFKPPEDEATGGTTATGNEGGTP